MCESMSVWCHRDERRFVIHCREEGTINRFGMEEKYVNKRENVGE